MMLLQSLKISQRHSLKLEQKLKQVLRQRLLLIGGFTSQSIFPRVEEILLSNSDYQRALQFVGRKKDMNKYHSIIDFILCETLPIFKNKCFAFYEGKNSQLIDDEWFNIAMRKQCEELLCFVLELCLEMYNKKLEQSWEKMRLTAINIILKAA